jgi:hypothetical protein
MKLSRWCPLVASISAVFLNTVSTTALANDDWWFDVEVIAFKRNVALTELEEQFSLADNLSAPRAQADLISEIIAPDISYLKQGLPVCGADNSIKWPDDTLFAVPSSDVDFLSLPKPLAPQEIDWQQDPPQQESYSAPSDKETDGFSGADALASEMTENGVIEDITLAPDAQTIAGYWTSFFGVKRTTPISVPAFKYCEEDKPWLSAEITTAIVASAASKMGKNDDAALPSAASSTLQPAIVWKVNKPDNRMPAPASLPIIIEGHDWPLASKAHLLTSNEQALSSISRQIRSSRDLERLFHATWRQPVMFGKNKAFDVRVYGGQNYAQQFTLDGEMRAQMQSALLREASNQPSMQLASNEEASLDSDTSIGGESEAFILDSAEEPADTRSVQRFASDDTQVQKPSNSELLAVSDIFTDLEMRLANPSPISFDDFKALDTPLIVEQDEDGVSDVAFRTPIWEIDGTIKVFLKYINRVPYLHVDSEMYYRQPVPLHYFSNEFGNEFGNEDASTNNVSNEKDSAATHSEGQAYKLVSVPLIEQRRIISTQLHYFDHPLFGFVVQVRRYNRPSADE